jgi:hypothetical protein
MPMLRGLILEEIIALAVIGLAAAGTIWVLYSLFTG